MARPYPSTWRRKHNFKFPIPPTPAPAPTANSYTTIPHIPIQYYTETPERTRLIDAPMWHGKRENGIQNYTTTNAQSQNKEN